MKVKVKFEGNEAKRFLSGGWPSVAASSASPSVGFSARAARTSTSSPNALRTTARPALTPLARVFRMPAMRGAGAWKSISR